MRGHDEQTHPHVQLPVAGTARAGRPSAPRRPGADGSKPCRRAPIREPVRHDRASVDPAGAIAAREVLYTVRSERLLWKSSTTTCCSGGSSG